MTEAATKSDKPKARQVSDPELIAMHEIQETLAELPPDTQNRVVTWMHDRWLSDGDPRE